MKAALQELRGPYAAGLREYCAGGGEAALLAAYQLGRRAVGSGVGVLEMATLHDEVLMARLAEISEPDESARVAKRASEFFAESLAPFELSRCGFQEAHAAMCDINQGLEERLRSLLQDFENAQGQLMEHKRLERLKNEFISVISHEVRTLTSIHGAPTSSRPASGDPTPRAAVAGRGLSQQPAAGAIRQRPPDLQRIESGTMTFLTCGPVELQSPLEQAVEASQAYASQPGSGSPDQVPCGPRSASTLTA